MILGKDMVVVGVLCWDQMVCSIIRLGIYVVVGWRWGWCRLVGMVVVVVVVVELAGGYDGSDGGGVVLGPNGILEHKVRP